MAANDNDPEFSDDLLRGAKAIAMFIFGSCDAKSVRRVYYLAEKTNLPWFEFGSMLSARRSALLKWVREQEERNMNKKKMG